LKIGAAFRKHFSAGLAAWPEEMNQPECLIEESPWQINLRGG